MHQGLFVHALPLSVLACLCWMLVIWWGDDSSQGRVVSYLPNFPHNQSASVDYDKHTTELFRNGSQSITDSPFWEPLRMCDRTSLDKQGGCRFYTAGVWKTDFLYRLQQATLSNVSEKVYHRASCDLGRAPQNMTCTTFDNGTMHLLAPLCRYPLDNEVALASLLSHRIPRLHDQLESSNASKVVQIAFLGNSVLRGVFHGFIRMIRGVTDGFDRQSHSTIVYTVTTGGDYTYFWDGVTSLNMADISHRAERIVGGKTILTVVFSFMCAESSHVEKTLTHLRPSLFDITLMFCSFTSVPPTVHEYKSRLKSYSSILLSELQTMSSNQSIVLFTSREQFPVYCWDTLRLRKRDVRLRARNVLMRHMVAKYTSQRTATNGHLFLFPMGEVFDSCNIHLRDELHAECVLFPAFPKNTSGGCSQGEGPRYPDSSHMILRMLAAAGV